MRTLEPRPVHRPLNVIFPPETMMALLDMQAEEARRTGRPVSLSFIVRRTVAAHIAVQPVAPIMGAGA